MKIRIQGGTARHDEPSLCSSCSYAKTVQGPAARDEIVRCGQLAAPVTFKVTSCSEYVHRAHPSLWHMESIAWILRTDLKRKQIGFVRAQDLKENLRHVLLDEDL